MLITFNVLPLNWFHLIGKNLVAAHKWKWIKNSLRLLEHEGKPRQDSLWNEYEINKAVTRWLETCS